MNEIDFARAGMLMHVLEKAAQMGPAATNITGEARLALAEIEGECYANAQERAKARAEEEARAQTAARPRQELAAASDDDTEPTTIRRA